MTHTGGDGDSDSDSDGDPLRPQYMPLAASVSNACQSDGDGTGTCYTAGDVRANAQPHLTAMHTLWMREHNRVAGLLAVVNPHWDDERAFQEARKIVVASIQHVTYGEWLPALLGKKYTKRNGLELSPKGYSEAYDENADPTVSNSFATAILPFVNSMFNETLRFVYCVCYIIVIVIMAYLCFFGVPILTIAVNTDHCSEFLFLENSRASHRVSIIRGNI